MNGCTSIKHFSTQLQKVNLRNIVNIVNISKYLKCPISNQPLKMNNNNGDLQSEYIVYKKKNHVFIVVEEKAEVDL